MLTDIATGWTECMQLLFREQALLTEVLSQMRERLPIDVLGSRSTNLQRQHADVVAERGLATEGTHLGQQRSDQRFRRKRPVGGEQGAEVSDIEKFPLLGFRRR